MSVCISAFFLERKYPLVCLFSYVWSAALPFCLLPTSSPACLPVFQGKWSPQPPPHSHVPYTHSASSALLLNEFHMALQAAVSARPAEEQSRHAQVHTNAYMLTWTLTHTQSEGSKVTHSRPWERNCLKVASHTVKTTPLPLSTESEGRMHTNVVWLTDWIAGGLKMLAV